MNWYKKAQTGEWWIIDGQASFADAEIGDMNHSGYVIDSILSNHDLEPERFDLTKENEQSLKLKGFSDEEISVLLDKTDPRAYAMKKWGWKRVQGNNVQTQTLTTDDLKDIANGLYDINDELSENDETTFNIEVVSTGAYYTSVPYRIISDENPGALRIYDSSYVMAQKHGWYKKSSRKIYIPAEDYDKLMALVDRMARGDRNWTSEDLQIQQNYPEAVEVLLKQKIPKTSTCSNGMCKLARKTIQQIALEVRKNMVKCYDDECLKTYCLPASRLLKSELIKSGYDATVTQGVFRVDNPDPSATEDWDPKDFENEEEMQEATYTPLHYWVEVGNTIIDITASQFNDELDDPVSPIEIGTYASLERYTPIAKDFI